MSETETRNRFRWLVLYVRPRYEKKVHARLLDAEIESFLALREEIRIWSDRKKKVIAPLFPGYLFVYVDERRRMEALGIDGAMKYVHFGGEIAEVRAQTIESLRIITEGPLDVEVVSEKIPAGAPVKVFGGPLMGMTGELVEYRGSAKVAVHIESIRQSVVVEIQASEIREMKT